VSSRKLGQNKETMREKLRRALNEEKAGLRKTDSDVPLLVESEVGDSADFVVPEKTELNIVSKKKSKKKSKAAADKKEHSPEIVDVAEITGAEQPAVAMNIVNTTVEQKPIVVGGALKQTVGAQPTPLVMKKRKKKKVNYTSSKC
jgi:hypothetical protein